MEKLRPFSPSELQLMISGEQVPHWTKEDVVSYTEPKYGFTRDSPVYQRFVNVLAGMSGDEKKVGFTLQAKLKRDQAKAYCLKSSLSSLIPYPEHA